MPLKHAHRVPFLLVLVVLIALLTGLSTACTPALLDMQAQAAAAHHTSTPAAAPSPGAAPGSSPLQNDCYTIARQAATTAGISPDLFVRQIRQESNCNPRALSPAGACGVAQFMPSTARGLGVDPWNESEALNAAAHLMASYARTYGDYAKALAAYNAGPGAVAFAQSHGSTWKSWLPTETQHYISSIMGGQ